MTSDDFDPATPRRSNMKHRISSPNEKLIGTAGSRQRLFTPCLLVDIDAVEHNISVAADICRRAGKTLRPHVKTHKSVEIARRQLAAGAIGLSTATVGEVETFAENGFGDILLTSTFAPDHQLGRLLDVAKNIKNLRLVLDNPETAKSLGEAACSRDLELQVYIDLDTGRSRSGCNSVTDAVALARVIDAQPSLALAGIQAYAGHLSHMPYVEERKRASADCDQFCLDVLSALGHWLEEPPVVSGGSTGMLMLDAKRSVLTELQCGSYVFMDVEYESIEPDHDIHWPFKASLFVRTTVVSANTPGIATTDAGDKRFSSKYGAHPRIVSGAPAGSNYQPTSDEHGRIDMPDDQTLTIGSPLECVPPHCDPTVNLFDHLHVVRGDELIDIWPVDARGVF